MVCDDEPFLREYVVSILESEGLQVETSFDGQEALEKIQENPNAYNVLITDNRMPRLTGIELVEKVRALKLPLKVIMISGIELQDTSLRNQPPDGFLSKTFTRDELLDCLKTIGCRAGVL